MNRKYNLFIFFGIIFTIGIGILLHFMYEWSGYNSYVGLISPINESVWEHLKLLFFPMSFWILLGSFTLGKNNKNYVCASILGLISGIILIPVLYYTFTPFLGRDNMILNIAIFVISICIAFLFMEYILKNFNLRFLNEKTGIFVWEIIFVLFVLFTLFPPNLPIFHAY